MRYSRATRPLTAAGPYGRTASDARPAGSARPSRAAIVSQTVVTMGIASGGIRAVRATHVRPSGRSGPGLSTPRPGSGVAAAAPAGLRPLRRSRRLSGVVPGDPSPPKITLSAAHDYSRPPPCRPAGHSSRQPLPPTAHHPMGPSRHGHMGRAVGVSRNSPRQATPRAQVTSPSGPQRQAPDCRGSG